MNKLKGGFSFCGTDIADIGLEYAPENENTYVYGPAKANIHKETYDGHDGGYLYGAYKETKLFTLRCFYEQTAIDKGLMANVHHLFRVGRSGMLVFHRRPWIYYYATVTEVDDGTRYSYLNGLVTVKMEAMYPLGRGIDANEHLFYNVVTDPDHDAVMKNTAIFEKEEMVPVTTFENITSETRIILANPGTERANVGITLSGTAGDGIVIYNKTTDQLCKYVAFDTGANESVCTDGISGKTVLKTGNTARLAFLYHHSGFLQLEPAFPCMRDLFISMQEGSNVITTRKTLFKSYLEKRSLTGRYLWMGKWSKIIDLPDEHTLLIEDAALETNVIKSTIYLMNELVITPLSGETNLSRISFIYKATYS